jgi:site-specific DNA-methyltransferase (cytosine-N4-specific)
MTEPTGITRGDAATILPTWPDHCAQTCITSPPYLQQRRYGDHPAEGGLQNTLDDYVEWLVTDVLASVRRILRPDGLLWLNIGDKANGSGGAGGDWSPTRNRAATGRGPAKFRDPTYPDQTFLDVPGAIIRSLLLWGWRLRRDITWDKGRQAPEDLRHVGRPREQHERILLFAPGPTRPRFYPSQLTETGSVWTFPPGGSGPAHLAPFPDELARRCILPSTLPGDLVIDPFAGSGTTFRVAKQLGRRAAGIDLYAESPVSSSAEASRR